MNGAVLALIGTTALSAAGCRAEAVKTGAARAQSSSRTTAAWSPAEGRELIGTRAPEFGELQFVQGAPRSLAALRGKLVLIRFWLVECPYCRATAPALNELHRRYAARGLVVLGIHHPKSEASRDLDYVRRTARELGFQFLVAHDDTWSTVRAYGVGSTFKSFTSVSFLIDREGKIAWVHDGGEFHAGGGAGHENCNRAFEGLIREVESRSL